jgi:hypothetical protein
MLDDRAPESLKFWEKMRIWMAAFPPAVRDRDLQESFGPLGLHDDISPFMDESSELAAMLIEAAENARSDLVSAQRRMGGSERNGWHLATHVVDYNVDFFEVGTIDTPEWKIEDREEAIMTRALVAMGGLWGNHGYEAAYGVTFVDADGNQLSGDHTYTLTLDPPPPAKAFWSLTMYDLPNYYLVENPIHRYSIGDRTPGLVTGTDGSVTITISRDPPLDAAARANWLPAPPGPFRPCLRMYIPNDDIIEGRYVIPPITLTDTD